MVLKRNLRRTPSHVRVMTVLAVGLVTTCGHNDLYVCEDVDPHCERPDTAVRDGGRADAAPMDASDDATAAADQAVDATPGCSSAPTDPCWVRMEALPGTCDIWRAQHPERIVIAPRVGCGAGCTRWDLEMNWGHQNDIGWVGADGVNYIHLTGSDPSAGIYPVDALVRTDGQVVFAVRYPLNGGTDEICWSTTMAASDGFAAFDVYWGAGADLMPAQDRVYYAPLADIASVAGPVHTVAVGGPVHVDRVAVSPRGVVWEAGVDGQGVIDGTFVDFGFGQHRPRLVGGDLLWINQTGELHVWSSDTDTTLFDLSPAIADRGVLTDGASIAWFEFVDMTNATGTLRTGPYVHSAAAFTARTVEGPRIYALSGVMGDGLVAHDDLAGSPVAWVGYRVVDIATGDARLFAPPAGHHPQWLHLVSAHELVFETNDSGGNHLWVVDPATLPLAPPVTIAP